MIGNVCGNIHMYLFYPEKERMYQPKFVTFYEIATEICNTSPEICNTLKIGSKSNLLSIFRLYFN